MRFCSPENSKTSIRNRICYRQWLQNLLFWQERQKCHRCLISYDVCLRFSTAIKGKISQNLLILQELSPSRPNQALSQIGTQIFFPKNLTITFELVRFRNNNVDIFWQKREFFGLYRSAQIYVSDFFLETKKNTYRFCRPGSVASWFGCTTKMTVWGWVARTVFG